MERQSYITRRFTEILKETISEKADELMGKLKFNPPGTSFDYVQEEGDPYSTEVKEKLVGGQKRLDKNKNNRIDSEDFAMLRKSKKKEMREYTMGDDAIEDVKPYDDITSTDSPKIRPVKKIKLKMLGLIIKRKLLNNLMIMNCKSKVKPMKLKLTKVENLLTPLEWQKRKVIKPSN